MLLWNCFENGFDNTDEDFEANLNYYINEFLKSHPEFKLNIYKLNEVSSITIDTMSQYDNIKEKVKVYDIGTQVKLGNEERDNKQHQAREVQGILRSKCGR